MTTFVRITLSGGADKGVPGVPVKDQRLAYIRKVLGLSAQLDGEVRYQLLHRTASAVIESDRFAAGASAMIVHSFSPEDRWFEDYARFVALFGGAAAIGRAERVSVPSGKPLYLGWAKGEQRFRAS